MLAARVYTSPEALFQEIAGESVILDLSSSTYFGLDEVGTRLWQLLLQDPDLGAACVVLQSEYEVTADRLERDIDTLVSQLVDAGLARLG